MTVCLDLFLQKRTGPVLAGRFHGVGQHLGSRVHEASLSSELLLRCDCKPALQFGSGKYASDAYEIFILKRDLFAWEA